MGRSEIDTDPGLNKAGLMQCEGNTVVMLFFTDSMYILKVGLSASER